MWLSVSFSTNCKTLLSVGSVNQLSKILSGIPPAVMPDEMREYARFARSGGTATIVQTVDIAHNQWKRTRLCVRWYFRTIFALLIFRCPLYPDILQRLLRWIFADIPWISHNFPFSVWGVNTCCCSWGLKPVELLVS